MDALSRWMPVSTGYHGNSANRSLEPPNGHGKKGEKGPRTYRSSLVLKRVRCSLDGKRALPPTPPR